MARDSIRNTAEQETLQTFWAVGTHHDQVSTPLLRAIENDIPGVPFVDR